MVMNRFLQTTFLVSFLLVPSQAYFESGQVWAIDQDAKIGTIYASQSGRATLDRGEDGGNPFASSLIELLNQPSISLAELISQIVVLTQQKSGGFQVPDITKIRGGADDWRTKPIQPHEKRLALVATFSKYEAADVSSLPGAERDRIRVTDALHGAGFEVMTIANPTKTELTLLLDKLAYLSKDAAAAFIYVTGHGFEHEGKVYLAPSDYQFRQKGSLIRANAISVDNLGNGLRAKRANIVFFGGCRTDLF
jgi:hypothetical protein